MAMEPIPNPSLDHSDELTAAKNDPSLDLEGGLPDDNLNSKNFPSTHFETCRSLGLAEAVQGRG